MCPDTITGEIHQFLPGSGYQAQRSARDTIAPSILVRQLLTIPQYCRLPRHQPPTETQNTASVGGKAPSFDLQSSLLPRIYNTELTHYIYFSTAQPPSYDITQ